MENTNSTGAVSGLDYNTIANENTKPIQEIAIKVVNDQNKQLPLAKGSFAEDGTVFPNESIILRGLSIIKENPYIGHTIEDTRTQLYEDTKTEVNYFKKAEFKHTLPIFQPKNIGKAIIAEYYKNKYNIDIYFINKNVQNSIDKLAQQLKNGEQIGIIATISPNKRHMTPIVICKQNEEVYIVTMDSINKKHNDFLYFFSSTSSLIETCGTQHCHLLHAGILRQHDDHSCMNDAIIILKDALRKPNLIDDLLKTNTVVNNTYTEDDDSETCYQVAIAEFPKYLYKTVQNKKLLDKLTTEDLQTSLTTESTNTASRTVHKTLQTHLDRYNRTLPVVIKKIIFSYANVEKSTKQNYWQVNTYLQTKPYRMLVKSVDEIADSNGKINQETATKLVEKYVNPSF